MFEGERSVELYIRQKVFSLRDRFSVLDFAGNDKYFVEGEFFSLRNKLHIYDTAGREVAYIYRKLFSFLPRYYVYTNGEYIAEIVREFTFLTPRYRIDGLGWRVEGDIFEHNYVIYEGERPVASIYKKWFSWGDCYVLDIKNDEDEMPALAVVLAIDCTLALQESSS